MIHLDSVTKSFQIKKTPPIDALLDVNLEIRSGEFVTIIGASGCGKSTLLFTIGGMQKPSKGTVSIEGIDVYGMSLLERANLRSRKIGFVFQTFNLIPYLNCSENVALSGMLAGKTRKSSIKRSIELLTDLGLENRLNHRAAELSIGEQQRVAIARSLINNPEIILADEPTGNMDPQRSNEIMQIFCELNSKGMTIIMVTHNHSFSYLGSRLIVLDRGCVLKDNETHLAEVG